VLKTATDFFWHASWWIGAATALLTVLMLLAIFVLQQLQQTRQRRERDFQARWQPLLMHAALGDGPVPPLSPLPARDAWRFIQLWVRFQASLRGQANERLRLVGQQCGALPMALQLMHSPHRSQQVFGLLALGYLREASAWDPLHSLLHQPSNTLAVYASWALLRIQPERAAPLVVEQLLARTDLDLMQVASVLKPFRASLHPVLVARVQQAGERCGQAPAGDDRHVAWLLKMSHAMALPIGGAAVSPLIENGTHIDIQIGAMQLLKTPDGLPAVRRLASHNAWPVRNQAAVALGRLGQPGDEGLLLQLLMDSQWWVRYRAARALADLPFLPRAQLAAQVASLPDRYARDMAQQVFAERLETSC
jgi:HEAT repeats